MKHNIICKKISIGIIYEILLFIYLANRYAFEKVRVGGLA